MSKGLDILSIGDYIVSLQKKKKTKKKKTVPMRLLRLPECSPVYDPFPSARQREQGPVRNTKYFNTKIKKIYEFCTRECSVSICVILLHMFMYYVSVSFKDLNSL